MKTTRIPFANILHWCPTKQHLRRGIHISELRSGDSWPIGAAPAKVFLGLGGAKKKTSEACVIPDIEQKSAYKADSRDAISAVRIPAHAKYALDEVPFQLPCSWECRMLGHKISGHVITSPLRAAIACAQNSAFSSLETKHHNNAAQVSQPVGDRGVTGRASKLSKNSCCVILQGYFKAEPERSPNIHSLCFLLVGKAKLIGLGAFGGKECLVEKRFCDDSDANKTGYNCGKKGLSV